jgi:hypothetical protein
MFRRKILVGLVLTTIGLATGCCHDKQTCCRPSCAPPPVSRAPCCPPAGGAAVAVPAAPVPVQASSSPAVSSSGARSGSFGYR